MRQWYTHIDAVACEYHGRGLPDAGIGTGDDREGHLEPVSQVCQRGPAGVCSLLVVRVRVGVQILAANGAEPRAVGPAEDLQRQRERDRVAGPGREVEPVLVEV